MVAAMDMMVQSINPAYSYQSKTAEIMSRYRPIAPKPAAPPPDNASAESAFSMCQETQPPPLWPRLHDRPARARKRARGAHFSLSLGPTTTTFKRATRTTNHHLLPLFSPHRLPLLPHPPPGLPTLTEQDLTELHLVKPGKKETLIDLNAKVDEIPEEKDLLRLLQEEEPRSTVTVIVPQPVRPIGSSISILSIGGNLGEVGSREKVMRKPEEVEEEVEMETFPAVISDSNNKVRLANSAYKEMVGQPECSWLGLGGGGSACKRIAGEVMLHVGNSSAPLRAARFSCWVRIEWVSNRKNSIDAFCNANRLSCESKDYAFAWRFHPNGKEVCQSST